MRWYKEFMRSTLFILAASAFVFTQQGCRSLQNIPGQWLAVPTGPDGRMADFSNRITSHLFDNGMMVGVGNDERFLYIFFSPDVSHRQRPPSRAQLILWLDTDGGKAQKLGLVHVSIRERGQRSGPDAPPAGQGDLAGAKAAPPPPPGMPAAASLLKIVDRYSGKESFVSADGSAGPSVRLADDWGDFAYQWRIPFQSLGEWPGLPAEPGKVLGIGLLWKINPLRNADQSGLDRSRPGSGHGGAPRGLAGGWNGAGRSMAPDDFKSERKIWLKTTLQQKKE